MGTVSKLCDVISVHAGMSGAQVRKYARELINAGELPKAIGRAIPTTTMQERVKLILAIAASDRPSGCVQRMRDLYEARARFAETKLSAGDAMARELQAFADNRFEAYRKWSYSDIEVSRTGAPVVIFRFNEKIQAFDNVTAQRVEFVGGSFLVKNWDDKKRVAHWANSGLPVYAVVPGGVLIAAASGSLEAAQEGEREVLLEANRAADEGGAGG